MTWFKLTWSPKRVFKSGVFIIHFRAVKWTHLGWLSVDMVTSLRPSAWVQPRGRGSRVHPGVLRVSCQGETSQTNRVSMATLSAHTYRLTHRHLDTRPGKPAPTLRVLLGDECGSGFTERRFVASEAFFHFVSTSHIVVMAAAGTRQIEASRSDYRPGRPLCQPKP